MHVVVWRETRGHPTHFLRHLFEMLLAMMLGMFAGGAVFVAATGISAEDAIENHSVAWVSVMAFSMTAPMVAWMRHRHHPWNVYASRWTAANGGSSDPALRSAHGRRDRRRHLRGLLRAQPGGDVGRDGVPPRLQQPQAAGGLA